MNYLKIYYEVKLNDPNTMMMQTKKKQTKKQPLKCSCSTNQYASLLSLPLLSLSMLAVVFPMKLSRRKRAAASLTEGRGAN